MSINKHIGQVRIPIEDNFLKDFDQLVSKWELNKNKNNIIGLFDENELNFICDKLFSSFNELKNMFSNKKLNNTIPIVNNHFLDDIMKSMKRNSNNNKECIEFNNEVEGIEIEVENSVNNNNINTISNSSINNNYHDINNIYNHHQNNLNHLNQLNKLNHDKNSHQNAINAPKATYTPKIINKVATNIQTHKVNNHSHKVVKDNHKVNHTHKVKDTNKVKDNNIVPNPNPLDDLNEPINKVKSEVDTLSTESDNNINEESINEISDKEDDLFIKIKENKVNVGEVLDNNDINNINNSINNEEFIQENLDLNQEDNMIKMVGHMNLKQIDKKLIVDLSRRKLSDIGLKYLSENIFDKIINLNLSYNNFTYTGIKCLSKIMKHVRVLNLSFNDLDSQTIKYLRPCELNNDINNNIHSIINSNINSNINNSINNNINNNNSNSININEIHNDDNSTLELQELILHRNNIDALGIKYLTHTTCFSNLTKLDISCNTIEDEGIANLYKNQASLKKLVKLNLCQNQITEKGIKLFSKCTNLLSHLKYLNLANNNIHKDGIMSVLTNKKCKKLVYLNISCCKISNAEDVIKYLIKSGDYEQLRYLNIGFNSLKLLNFIMYTGDKVFCLPNLERLSLSSCNLNDHDIDILCETELIKKLKYLNLHGNKIVDKGIGYLIDAFKDTPNIEINVAYNDLKQKIIRQLKDDDMFYI